eukprot:2268520-Amphidinium_carterae.1
MGSLSFMPLRLCDRADDHMGFHMRATAFIQQQLLPKSCLALELVAPSETMASKTFCGIR